MRKSLVVLAIACTCGLMMAAQAQAGELTLMFGRGVINATDSKCRTLPGSVSLFTIADDLKARGLVATMPESPSQLGDGTTHVCTSGNLYANWDDLANLRDNYGWTAVPRGLTNDSLKAATDPLFLDSNVCGALQPFYAHGHTRAWGMYAWPQNRWTLDEEATYVPKCYAYGRKYTNAGRSFATPIKAPYYWAPVASVNGGKCANASLACHTFASKGGFDYTLPSTLITGVTAAAGPNRWSLIQWYKLVTGSYGKMGDRFAWDCTSPDAADHWASMGELYCYVDYEAVIAAIQPGTIVTDPATVAELTDAPRAALLIPPVP